MNSAVDIASLRGRIDLVQVISHYLHLQRQGAGYVGLCPFHDDKHPSLQVSPSKGLFHCFSCGEGGDAFTFVQKREGCGFKEAVRICTDICHVGYIPREEPMLRPEEPKSVSVKQHPTAEENERFWQSLLPYEPEREELRETYEAFGVRVAPPVLPPAYRFMQGRLIFPIRDAAGALVAFAARYRGTGSEGGREAKYLNSETSPIYKKDTLLYAWYRAEAAVRETGRVFVTEGYKDALAMHAAGFTESVALCGVNLSDAHLSLIRGAAETVYLFLDNDAAGRQTVDKLIPQLRKAGLQVVDLIPEGGKDPDDMFRDMGRTVFSNWLRRAILPAGQQAIETLLLAACIRWPEMLPVVAGETLPAELHAALGACSTLPAETRQSLTSRFPELDKLYEQHTGASHPEEIRREELLAYLLLCYREVSLEGAIRHTCRHLSLSAGDEYSRSACLTALQQKLLDLCTVSKQLRRRG